MARNVEYVPNRRGTGQLLKSAEMARLVLDAAEAGADAARVAAPRASGTLAASVHVEYAGNDGGPAGDRVEARVVSDAPHTLAVQFGTSRMKAQPFMEAAIDAIEGGS